MHSYFLRPRAVSDLDSIWEYTEGTWGEDQAVLYLRKLDRAFSDIAINPTLGRSAENIRQGYFRFIVGKHVVFYREIESNSDVDTVRVLHQSMDFERHF
jgi:toxin ParE1/3/4